MIDDIQFAPSTIDDNYVSLISHLFTQSRGRFTAKVLYCRCGNELYGERRLVPGLSPWASFFYECGDCDFFIQGNEARVLYDAFREDLI